MKYKIQVEGIIHWEDLVDSENKVLVVYNTYDEALEDYNDIVKLLFKSDGRFRIVAIEN